MFSSSQYNPKHIYGDALTDLSFVKWTSYSNSSSSNLFIGSSHVSDFIDLYEFNKHGYPDKNDSTVKRITRFVASARIASLSDARSGLLAYGCNNGRYGLLEILLKPYGESLVTSKKLWCLNDGSYIRAIDLKDGNIFIGTFNGTLAVRDIRSSFGSKSILTEHNFPIKAIHASSSYLCLAGHGGGTVSLWDLRSREENVLNSKTKKNYRSSCETRGDVTSCHLKNGYLAIVGTSLGTIKFMDMRYESEKYPCELKASQKAITSVRFAENSSNMAMITCYEGYAEIRNDVLASLWFSDPNDAPPWLKGNHYDKLQTSWSCKLNELIGLDTMENRIIMGTNGGDLCFILP